MRVLIADDHPLFLDAARTHLERIFPVCEVVEARSLPDAVHCLGESGPFHLILLDLSMPGMNPSGGVAEAVGAAGAAPVVIFSGTASPDDVWSCVAAGAKGFLPKTLDAAMFAAALNIIMLGGTYVPAEFAASRTAPVAVPANARDLSAREIDVLRMLVTGASNKEIARELNIQEVTVKLHATRIFNKLGVKNRSQAAVMALECGLVSRQG
jgi:DNA-binding NarL/FixJ family response regulator